MTTTPERNVRVPAPRLPHPDSFADPHLSITDEDATVLLTYCPRNQVGAIFNIGNQRWSVYSPLSLHTFLDLIPRLGFKLAETPALQEWLDAISAGAQQPSSRGH